MESGSEGQEQLRLEPLSTRRSSRPFNLTSNEAAGDRNNNIGGGDAAAYDLPTGFSHLTEISAPEPVENVREAPLYRHSDVETPIYTGQRRKSSHASAPDRRRSSTTRIPGRHKAEPRRLASHSASSADPGMRMRSHEPDVEYDAPFAFGDLNEVRSPPPVENPDELPIARHHSLEERVEGRKSWSAARREEEDAADGSPQAVPDAEQAGRRPGQGRVPISRLLTEVYTVGYLIFFSILGTLARLGLNSLTTYTGAPVSFGVLWSNFAGTAVLGFLAELSPLIHERVALDEKAADVGDDSGNTSSSSSGSGINNGGVVQLQAESDEEDGGGNNGGGGTEPAPPPWKQRPIPLYVGLATGFCGSFTSFSSFIMDTFDALSNALPAPHYYTGDGPATSVAARGTGSDVMALLAVVALTVCMCLSALKFGAHIAIAVSRYCTLLSPRIIKVIDKCAVVLALGGWLAVVLLAIFPPDRTSITGRPETWRGDVLFALVFSPLGCLVRFYISLKLNAVFATFPLGTFVVNILGTAVLGMAWDLQHAPTSVTNGSVVGCQILQGVMDGFCGCLTTVSTWMTELSGLRRRHAYFYGCASVATGLSVLVLIMGTLKWTVGWHEPVCTVS